MKLTGIAKLELVGQQFGIKFLLLGPDGLELFLIHVPAGMQAADTLQMAAAKVRFPYVRQVLAQGLIGRLQFFIQLADALQQFGFVLFGSIFFSVGEETTALGQVEENPAQIMQGDLFLQRLGAEFIWVSIFE